MPVARYGIFKFRTAANSAPTTPSSHSQRLRPSMLNLEAISRNLFGSSSVSSRSTQSDLFSTTSSSKRKVGVSRSSTMETGKFSMASASSDNAARSSDERLRTSRASTAPSESSIVEDESSVVIPAGVSPYKYENVRESEVDLNERLNMARKNSKSMARLTSPPPPPTAANTRLNAARSVIELRTMAEMQSATETRTSTWSMESSRIISKDTMTEQEIEEWSFSRRLPEVGYPAQMLTRFSRGVCAFEVDCASARCQQDTITRQEQEPAFRCGPDLAGRQRR